MHFLKLSSVTAIFFTSVLLIGACGEGDPEMEEPVGVVESSLQACGSGLYCSTSYTSGATYCQSGQQQVYCCPSGQGPSGGVCKPCTTTCSWVNKCRPNGTWHDNYKVWTCVNSCTGAKTEGQTCCWTSSPGSC